MGDNNHIVDTVTPAIMDRWIVRQFQQQHTWMRCSSLVPSKTCIPQHQSYLTMTTILFILHPTVEGIVLRQYLHSNDVILLDTIGENKKKRYTSQHEFRTGHIYHHRFG